MRARWLVNLLLLILVIALGTLMRRELEQERRVSTLTGMGPEQITEISIERPDGPSIRLVQGRDGWRMERPYPVTADAERIGELVRIASTPVHRTLPKSASAERLGLDADSLRLTLNGLVLRFGDIDPIGQHRYVAVGGQVHLIGDGFHHHLLASAEDYVGRTLLPHGFRSGGGTLNGAPLSQDQLAALDELAADTVEPLGTELSGWPLSVASDDGTQTLRFLISEEGHSWARLDLRLRYLVATPPDWASSDPAPGPDQAGVPQIQDPDR